MAPPEEPALAVESLPAGAATAPSVPDASTTKRSAIRNSVITLGGYGASAAIRFGSNLILTRLLLPEQFGIMAIVNVVIVWLYLFSDIGIGPNIIQSHEGENPTFLNTAWTIQVFRGIALWLIATGTGAEDQNVGVQIGHQSTSLRTSSSECARWRVNLAASAPSMTRWS